MNKLMIIAMVAAGAFQALAITGKVQTELETIEGEIKWQPRSKSYLVEKGKISREVKLADVAGLDIPKPNTFDKAVSLVEAGQGAAAIPMLTKIVSEYRMLQWDKQAGRYLVMAYLASGNAQKAYDACQPIINEDKSAEYSGDLASAYWQTLMKLGKFEKLEALLKKASTSGSRQAAAAALVMRGDLLMNSASDNNELVRQALRDGYLRVVLMYQDADCRRERSEACVKAAAAFDKLGQSARAEKLRAQAKAI